MDQLLSEMLLFNLFSKVQIKIHLSLLITQGIALASPFSKLMEWCTILIYAEYLISSNLQFGLSTSMCTGLLKIVAGEYICRGSKVHCCLVDASKAFDSRSHSPISKTDEEYANIYNQISD